MFTLSAVISTIVSPMVIPVMVTVFHAITDARQRSLEWETRLLR
jgi:hypothetical protein